MVDFDVAASSRLVSRRRALWLAAGTCLAASAARAQEAPPSGPPVGAVEAVVGETQVERGGRVVNLANGAPVMAGDMVATGENARLLLVFGGNTRIRLGGRTKLRIDRMQADGKGELALGGGAILYDRPDRGPKADVELNTLFARLTARGGRFFAGTVEESGFGVLVLRGALRVAAGGGVVNLEPGEGTDILQPGAPPAAGRPWSEGRIRAALARVE